WHFICCHRRERLATVVLLFEALHLFHDRADHKLAQGTVPLGDHGVQDRTAQSSSVLGFLVKTHLIGVLTRCCFRVLQHVFGRFGGGLFILVDSVLSRFGKRFGNGDTKIKGTLLFDISRCFNGGFRRFSSFGRLKVKQRFMVSLGHVSPVVMVDGVCGRL